MKKFVFAAMSLIVIPLLAQAADEPVPEPDTTIKRETPNNTNINKRDRTGQTLTPLDQSNTKEDIYITQTIRKAIMKEDFSMDAKNIKIITRNGEVTLRGPVTNSTEVEKIVELAKAVPGIKILDNQLEVK